MKISNMKVFLWIYAVVGSLYFMLYSVGTEVVVRHVSGPLWVMMMAAPIVLGLLVFFAISQRLGPSDK